MFSCRRRISCAFLAVSVSIVALCLPAFADVHTVQINEFYTQCDNGSPSVQYIEIKPQGPGNLFRQCASIEVRRSVGAPLEYFQKPVFVGHLDTEAFPAQRTFLIATPSFQTLTGVVPDLLMPDGTLDPDGGVIRFAADSGCTLVNHGTIHEVRFGDQGSTLAPGLNMAANLAIGGVFFEGTPTPKNFAGSTASSWMCSTVPVEHTTWGAIKAVHNE